MLIIEPAGMDDIYGLIELESLLFTEDAGRHERFADVTWPQREGRRDFERLITEQACIVLVARHDEEIIGHLVGYVSKSSPTRRPVMYAIIRSMYVKADCRRTGVGGMMTERFLAWAADNDCVEAHVDSYVANEPAQQFYERLGFTSHSISRVRRL